MFPTEVRFRDLDALGHVNNAVYLTYLESARIAWWLELTGRSGLGGMDIILARVELDYRSPVVYGDRLDVSARCLSFRRSSFVLVQSINEHGSGRLVADARKVLVHYDFAKRQATPIPPAMRLVLRDSGAVEEAS